MNKNERETEKILIDHEKEALNQLKKTYKGALDEVKIHIRDLQNDIAILEKNNPDNPSLVRSKIYQLNYQKAMEEQLNAVLDMVKTSDVKTTQSFLTKMYEDSYLSINYNLQKKGIPVIMPINHKKIVDVINKPTEKLNFKDRTYKNVDELKKVVKAEISRGIAVGSSYGEIARQIDALTDVGVKKAYRIVRTEGGRVSSEAKLTSIREAKKRGADLVKVWDATLDMKTRTYHLQLDGKWAEVDEPFKIGGMEPMAPHDFGRPEEDINCRCVLLSLPRWDLEDTYIKRDNITGELIEAKNYEDWKNKYYDVINSEAYKKGQLKQFIYDSKTNSYYVRNTTKGKEEPEEVVKVVNEAKERIERYEAGESVADVLSETKQVTASSFEKIRNGNDFEISGDVRDLYLSKETREKVDILRNQIKTASDFEEYLKEKGIKLEIESDALKGRMNDEIEAVKRQIDYNISAIEQYEKLGGLSKLHTIHFFNPDLDVGGQYIYTAIGEERPEDDGHVYFKNFMSGFEVMHEYAHIWADSTKPTGEDAVTWSAILNEVGKLDKDAQAYFGANANVYEAEKFADAVARAICYGKEKDINFLTNVSNAILDEERKKKK